MADDTPYKVTSTGKVIHNLEQTKHLTVPPEESYQPEDGYFAGKGCVCGAYGQCECGCGVDWTDPEIYKLRQTVSELEENLRLVRGAMAAQDAREKKAGEVCGVSYDEYGCDWPDAAAERIINLKKELEFYKGKL